MKWHKFVIYFQLWFAVFIEFCASIMLFDSMTNFCRIVFVRETLVYAVVARFHMANAIRPKIEHAH